MTKFPTWEQFKAYLEYEVGRGINSHLLSCYRLIVDYFKDKEFNKENLRLLVADLKSGKLRGIPLKNETVNKYIMTAKHLAHYLDLGSFDTFKGLKKEGAKSTRSYLTPEEILKIINIKRRRINTGFKHNKALEQRHRAILLTLALTGLRPHELCGLTWNDFKETYLEIDENKTRTPRKVPVPNVLKESIINLPRYPHSYIFGSRQGKLKPSTINEELKNRSRLLGLDKHITAYDLRHSFVTNCILNGGEGSLKEVARIAGHSIDTCYKVYMDLKIEHLKTVVERINPLVGML